MTTLTLDNISSYGVEELDAILLWHEVAERHVLLHLLAQRGLVADVTTQQVTAGDVRDAEPLSQQSGMRSLAGAWSTDQEQAHLTTRSARRPPDSPRSPDCS